MPTQGRGLERGSGRRLRRCRRAAHQVEAGEVYYETALKARAFRSRR